MTAQQVWGRWPSAGTIGGAIFWFGAHELGFYFSALNCQQPWILPLIHALALIGSLFSGWVSYQSCHRADQYTAFMARIGVAAAGIFTLVILWQGIATLIFSGCER